MKKIYFLLIGLCFFASIKAQIVNIPDANFKSLLINSSPYGVTAFNLSGNKFKVDSNNDGQIQKSEAEQVSQLRVYGSNIASLEGIQSFINLNILYCYSNSLTSLDMSYNTKMVHLWCSDNQLTSLNLGSANLNALNCSHNLLKNLDISNCTIIANMDCSFNQLTSLEMHNANNTTIYCSNNQLISLFIKDGMDNNFLTFDNNPNLQYICVDDIEVGRVQNLVNQYRYTNCHINSYCSFEPGGKYYTIQGSKKIDSNT
ncbi:MAG: T9SS C-terminal target domain-containing protein, partial [Flavobacteriaceae bacterium]|nr:T9SS C-terminal target domain-containing protein [Flavobacteriaceae bacterium]